MDSTVAYDRVIRLLTGRAHSRAELIRKLKARGASAAVALEAVDKAAAQGYVNDAEYARMYARQARDHKGLAPLRIKAELAKRGVEAHHVEEALGEVFAETDIADQACALAQKRALRLSGDIQSKRRRLAAFLERRGFPVHVTLAAVVIIASIGLCNPAQFLAIRRIRQMEFRWALFAVIGVVLLGTLKGVLVAVVISLVALMIYGLRSPVHVLGRKPGTNVFRPRSAEHPEDEAFPGLLLLGPEGLIYFGNVPRIAEQIGKHLQDFFGMEKLEFLGKRRILAIFQGWELILSRFAGTY
jgi:SOS response regulatory protein OraA/RecX